MSERRPAWLCVLMPWLAAAAFAAEPAPVKKAMPVPALSVPVATPSAPQPVQVPPLMPMQRVFTPRTLTTGQVAMTGLRFIPVSVSATTVTMTGMRFVPVAVDTGSVTMTGLR